MRGCKRQRFRAGSMTEPAELSLSRHNRAPGTAVPGCIAAHANWNQLRLEKPSGNGDFGATAGMNFTEAFVFITFLCDAEVNKWACE